MRTVAILIIQPVLAVHVKVHTAKQAAPVKALRIPDTFLTVAIRIRITAKPHRLASFEHAHTHLFHHIRRYIQTLHITFCHRANIVERIIRIQRLERCRLTCQCHKRIQIQIHILCKEFLWCDAKVIMAHAILILPGKVKLLHRFTKDDALHAVHLCKHVLACFFHIFAIFDHIAQNARILAQHSVQHPHEQFRMLRLVCFRHGTLGHNAILLHQIHVHVPIAPIMETLEHIFHHPVIQRLIRILHNQIQEVIGFFQLVIESQIIPTQLEIVQTALLDDSFPHHVQCRKGPAAAALFLCCDAMRLHFIRIAALQARRLIRIKHQILQFCTRTGRMHGHTVAVTFICLPETIQHFFCNCLHLLPPDVPIVSRQSKKAESVFP